MCSQMQRSRVPSYAHPPTHPPSCPPIHPAPPSGCAGDAEEVAITVRQIRRHIRLDELNPSHEAILTCCCLQATCCDILWHTVTRRYTCTCCLQASPRPRDPRPCCPRLCCRLPSHPLPCCPRLCCRLPCHPLPGCPLPCYPQPCCRLPCHPLPRCPPPCTSHHSHSSRTPGRR